MKLTDFIEDDQKKETTLIQAKVDTNLHTQAVEKMNKISKAKNKKMTWNDVMTAALKMLIAE